MTNVTEKECRLCHVVKPASEFYASKQTLDGLYSYCKACQIAKQKRVQKESPRRRQNPPGLRWCQRCKTYKPPDQFHKNASQFDGLSLRCAQCITERHKVYLASRPGYNAEMQRTRRQQAPSRYRDYELKKNYGLPHGTYARMFAEQNGVCGICKEPAQEGKHLHVDHCHDTNTVRGLLCGRCNTGIGQLRHSKQLLLSAVEYLSTYGLPVSGAKG